MNSIINRIDIVMISLFIIIITGFGIYKYLHNKGSYDDSLDLKVRDILNKKDIIVIKQEEKVIIPETLTVEDYHISEFLIKSDGAIALEDEMKSRL